MKYILTTDTINGIEIKCEVFEKIDYCIEERKDLIDNLIQWISERNRSKELMMVDLKMLMNQTENYLLSSLSTNEYIFEKDAKFETICNDILKENKI